MKWLCKCGWFGTADDAARKVRKPQPAGFKQDGHTPGTSRLMCPTCAGVDLRPMSRAERLERETVAGAMVIATAAMLGI